MSAAGNWCLIESDPGVFTELIRGFGKKFYWLENKILIVEETLIN